MRWPFDLSSLPIAFLTALAGCSSLGETEDLANLSAETEVFDQGAAAAAAGADAYFAIAADWRACAPPECGGWYLERLNRANTRCHDGRRAESCYTPVLDWSQANLSEAKQSELLYACYDSSLSEGVFHAVVRGRFERTNSTTRRPELGRFVVSEAWVADGDGVSPSEGVFVAVRDNGLRCLVAPCPNFTETALNLSRSTDIAEVDFTPSGLSDSDVEECIQSMYTPEGIMVAGYRYTVNVDGRTARGRTATAAYDRLVDTE